MAGYRTISTGAFIKGTAKFAASEAKDRAISMAEFVEGKVKVTAAQIADLARRVVPGFMDLLRFDGYERRGS